MPKTLRPNNFVTFIGQEKLKSTLKVMIKSATLRQDQLDHILLYGPPGLGKTSLATVISNEIESNIRYAQGPMLEKKSDLLSLLGSVSKGEIIFIDEIHGINKNIEEILYSAMEDRFIDIMIGPEEESKIVRVKIAPFTIIAATTRYDKISKPLRDRFGLISKLKDYDKDEINKIILNSSKILNFSIDKKAICLISDNSQSIPRVANNLLRRSIDFSIDSQEGKVSLKIVKKTLDSLGIYKLGLRDSHIDYLSILSSDLENKSMSLETITSLLYESKENIEKNVEPILISKGLIQKTTRGRKITSKGIDYITTYNL